VDVATVHPYYEAVCRELDRRRRVALGFERIEALLRLLSDPHRCLETVQIVGTNGKGTTAVSLMHALEATGQSSGVYLSPHVLSYTERVMLRGRFVSEKEFTAAMGKAIEVADANGVPATQFELLTAGALLAIRDAGLKWAILEAGLGARHDATSAAESSAVVLSNVGLDHTEYLGGTVEEIAEEKLASLRPGATLVLGTDDPRVLAVARRAGERVGASVVKHEKVGGFDAAGDISYLARNERLGVRAAEVLIGRPLRRDERTSALAAARSTRLPARFEVHEVRGVPVVVDGGHNLEGLEAALEAVRARYRDRPLGVVFGALKGKDIASMLNTLEGEADVLVLARPANDEGRALDPKRVEEEYGPRDSGGGRALVVDDTGDALRFVVGEVEKVDGVVLVTGSLYTGAGALGWLRGDSRG
jgi:dihydrofolate synthase / folylpolyglutamate synthase